MQYFVFEQRNTYLAVNNLFRRTRLSARKILFTLRTILKFGGDHLLHFCVCHLPKVKRCVTFSLLMEMPLSNKHLRLLPARLVFQLIMCAIAKAIKTQKKKCVCWK